MYTLTANDGALPRRRPRCHSAPHADTWIFTRMIVIIVSFCRLSSIFAQEDSPNNDDMDFHGDVDEAWFMLLIMSLLFGFLMTLFGSVVGYFCILEDKLMRRYWRHGETIIARIISSDFARGGAGSVNDDDDKNNNNAPTNSSYDVEYICFCEYERKLAQNYTVRIRKQCKVKARDFVDPPRPGSEVMLWLAHPTESLQINDLNDGSAMFVELPEQPDTCCIIADDDDNDVGFQSHVGGGGGGVVDRNFLEMLILPGHERSAFPKKAVLRACSAQYRFPTVGLLLFCIGLAAGCTYWAIHEVQRLQDDDRRAVGWKVIIMYAVLVVMELPIIFGCCHSALSDALREEYLESGEFVPLMDDSSSLSSLSGIHFLSSPARNGSSSQFI